ncbi:MAG: DUF1295 domain-containing protein [Cytophagaceae bacterium]|nr:DUF1295 domain-containing protein [Cytophagaceae bacterium]
MDFLSILLVLLQAFFILFILMSITWLIQLRTNNAGIVDIVWAISFPIFAIFYFFISDGFIFRKQIFLGMVLLWGLCLGLYLFIRNTGKHEDVRYSKLREEWGAKASIKMFFFFQFQAALATVLSIPFLLIMNNTFEKISLFEYFGMGLWAIALLGEAIADSQLKAFKKDPSNKGKICECGLWYYSRHPNYFFEWLVWLSFFIFALASPYGWIAIICPAMMLWFLLKVTGIPMTEELMLKSRGEAFKKYQESTSAFVPWFKKK